MERKPSTLLRRFHGLPAHDVPNWRTLKLAPDIVMHMPSASVRCKIRPSVLERRVRANRVTKFAMKLWLNCISVDHPFGSRLAPVIGYSRVFQCCSVSGILYEFEKNKTIGRSLQSSYTGLTMDTTLPQVSILTET